MDYFYNMRGQIYIIGDIGQFSEDSKFVELVDVIAQVRNQPEATAFDVFIDSPGGRVNVGMDIFNYLTNLGKPIHTIGMNLVASIATVIHMAGQTRTIRPNTDYMIHLPWGGADGTSEEIAEYAKELKEVENQLLKFYTDHTSNTKEAILPLLKNETWLTPEQLLSLGFITEMPVSIAAKIDFKNPKQKKMSEEKNTSILQKILDALTKKDPVAKILFTDDQRELVFDAVADEDPVVPGDRATLDGQPAEGDITMADGRVFTFTAGELIEITEDVPDDGAAEELQAQLDAATQELADLKTAFAALKAENDKNKAIIAKIEKIGSQFQPDKNDPPRRKKPDAPSRSKFGQALERKKNANAKQ